MRAEEGGTTTAVGGDAAAVTQPQGAKGLRLFDIRPSDLMQGLGGLTVLMLGGLYGIGALLTMADLHGADVRIRDALPLIPLEDLLARGIGVTVYAVLVMLGLGVFAIVYDGYQRAAVGSGRERVCLILFSLMFYGFVVLALTVLPVLMGAGILMAAVAMYVLTQIEGTTHRQDLAIAMLLVVVGVALHAYLAPEPLVEATLTTQGKEVTGDLVTIDDRWYLARGDSIVAVDSDADTTAELTPQAGGQLQDGLTEILGLPVYLTVSAFAFLLLALGAVTSRLQRWLSRRHST